MALESKDDQVFEIGEQTIFAMRSQEFELDELGTMVARPKRPAPEPAPDLPERFTRIERRVNEIHEFLRSLEARLR
jgi:hypothetical protein